MNAKRLRLVSMVLFAACMPITAFHAGNLAYKSWQVLLIGFLGFGIGNWAGFGWWSNVLLLGSWFVVGTNRKAAALLLTFCALALALPFLTMHEFVAGHAGDMQPLKIDLGYWTWLASLAMAIAAATQIQRQTS
jgi:hypothetical protein